MADPVSNASVDSVNAELRKLARDRFAAQEPPAPTALRSEQAAPAPAARDSVQLELTLHSRRIVAARNNGAIRIRADGTYEAGSRPQALASAHISPPDVEPPLSLPSAEAVSARIDGEISPADNLAPSTEDQHYLNLLLRSIRSLYAQAGKEFDAEAFEVNLANLSASLSSAHAGAAFDVGLGNVQAAHQTGGAEQMETVEVSAESIDAAHVEGAQADPLVLDLDGGGVELGGAHDGPVFDITGTGQRVRTAFVQGSDALLALDRNGNGAIDDGRELFGDQHGARDGFAELARFDTNGDRVIDARDPVFGALQLLSDLDRNGRAQPFELADLAAHGITAIELVAEDENLRDSHGNTLVSRARFHRADGSAGFVHDVLLNYLV